MLERILKIVSNEDTFRLFSTNVSPSIFDIQKHNLRTIYNIKMALEFFFIRIIETSSPDSLYWAEANRMLRFVNKLFNEINEISREGATNDDFTDCYIESISEFVKDIKSDLLSDQVRFITK